MLLTGFREGDNVKDVQTVKEIKRIASEQGKVGLDRANE